MFLVFILGGKSSSEPTRGLLSVVSKPEMVGPEAKQACHCSEHLPTKSSESADDSSGRKPASYTTT